MNYMTLSVINVIFRKNNLASSALQFAIFLFPVPPDILDYMTSTDMIVREGSNVTLRCAAKGSPTPNITWRREDGDTILLGNGEDGKRRVIKNKTAMLYDVFLRLKKSRRAVGKEEKEKARVCVCV